MLTFRGGRKTDLSILISTFQSLHLSCPTCIFTVSNLRVIWQQTLCNFYRRLRGYRMSSDWYNKTVKRATSNHIHFIFVNKTLHWKHQQCNLRRTNDSPISHCGSVSSKQRNEQRPAGRTEHKQCPGSRPKGFYATLCSWRLRHCGLLKRKECTKNGPEKQAAHL